MKNGHHSKNSPDILSNLQAAIRRTQDDLRRVEIWAGALTAFSQPVPEYRPSDAFLLRSPPSGRAAAYSDEPS